MLAERSRRTQIVLTRAIWEWEMRFLNTTARCLAAGLLALVGRALLDGLTVAGGLSGARLVVLLLGCPAVLRRGHRLEPREEPVAPQRLRPMLARRKHDSPPSCVLRIGCPREMRGRGGLGSS
jgi:hypothetical protein